MKHYKPATCFDCGTKLSRTDASPVRHQVTELPAVKPIVTEHQVHSIECPHCGKVNQGRMPSHVPTGILRPDGGVDCDDAQQSGSAESENDGSTAAGFV